MWASNGSASFDKRLEEAIGSSKMLESVRGIEVLTLAVSHSAFHERAQQDLTTKAGLKSSVSKNTRLDIGLVSRYHKAHYQGRARQAD